MKRVSLRRLKGFAREESVSAKEYRKLGFLRQARDERRHSRFFKKLATRQVLIKHSGKFPEIQWAKKVKLK